MQFGLRTKEILAITLLTFLVVAATTFIHLSQLTRVVVQEAALHTELIAKQIYAHCRGSLSRWPGRTREAVLTNDQELRSLVDASIGYSPHLLYALIADAKGKAILHSEREKEGSYIPERPSLGHLNSFGPLRRFYGLYQGGGIYETSLPLSLGGRRFAKIRLGIATSLLRKELSAALRRSLAFAGIALSLAWLVAMVLANRMLAEFRALSLVDELTGLHNRRGFLFLAQQQLKIADRMKRGILLLFADLDGLKLINDTYGHQEGDRALVEASRILKETFREADIVARIGGDEFAVITIEAPKDSAQILMARLRERVDAHNAARDRRYKLSFSAGTARYDAEHPSSIDELLVEADSLMYKQKHGRRQS